MLAAAIPADSQNGGCGMDEIRIGDVISLDGRTFTVRGFDPMSMPEQTVELTDTETGTAIRIPIARLHASEARTGSAVRSHER